MIEVLLYPARRFLLLKANWGEFHLEPYFYITDNGAFLDVGANTGYYTKLIAPKCKKVYAWEPNPRTAQDLKRNLKR